MKSSSSELQATRIAHADTAKKETSLFVPSKANFTTSSFNKKLELHIHRIEVKLHAGAYPAIGTVFG